MKNPVICGIFILAAGLLVPKLVQAQGTLQVSNLGQTPTGSAALGSDSWIAQSFFVLANNPNTYSLDSVQLLMNPGSGQPSGFSVSIYNVSNGSPQADLGTLAGPDPVGGGVFTYAASGITLSAGNYAVVVTASTPLVQGYYDWSAANGQTPGNGLAIDNNYFSSTDGSSWTGHVRQNVFQMAIYATQTPEPGVIGLFALGGLFVAFQRRKAKPF
ncbi:MAG TPA: PEP-CTERM sorting domain-containing protein [Verrucomicrobiae bacterium]|jgi:hypothetical protein|nr:PEP-CTERM sorting domain-containing protein [Verrucomicrobiae bacterium]